MYFLLDILSTRVHIVLEQSRYKGGLGFKFTSLVVQKAANVVKATIFQVYGVLAWWEKALSHSLLFLSSKHFSAFHVFRHLELTHLKSFLRRAWLVKNMMEQSDNQHFRQEDKNMYIFIRFFFLFWGVGGIKLLSQRQRNAAMTWPGAPARSSAAWPSLRMSVGTWPRPELLREAAARSLCAVLGSINPPTLPSGPELTSVNCTALHGRGTSPTWWITHKSSGFLSKASVGLACVCSLFLGHPEHTLIFRKSLKCRVQQYWFPVTNSKPELYILAFRVLLSSQK